MVWINGVGMVWQMGEGMEESSEKWRNHLQVWETEVGNNG